MGRNLDNHENCYYTEQFSDWVNAHRKDISESREFSTSMDPARLIIRQDCSPECPGIDKGSVHKVCHDLDMRIQLLR